MVTVNNLVKELLKRGVSVDLELTEYGQIGYNVCTGAKSSLVLVEDQEQNWLMCFKRYDKDSVVSLDDDLETVLYNLAVEVKDCMCGRGYVSEYWETIMIELDVIKIETKTTRSIIF
ncbi:hypothetical protein VP14_215 [Vibrio phage VPMCC14]|nr:hypothetical protein VP14_215 [Vibrio phage VPMCC14]